MKKDRLDGFEKWSGRAQVHFMHSIMKKIASERHHKAIADINRALEKDAEK